MAAASRASLPSAEVEALCARAALDWAARVGPRHPGWPLARALVRRFLGGIEWTDRVAARAAGPCIFVANHQTYIESILFCVAMPALLGRPVVALARAEQRKHWTGELDARWSTAPGHRPLDLVEYFDRDDPGALGPALEQLSRRVEGGASVLVHVEGTRRRSVRQGRVQLVSTLWGELAVERGWPIVPVRFLDGLPLADQGRRYDFPVDYGPQRIRVGRPAWPVQLAALDPDDRRRAIRDGINGLGDPSEVPRPSPDAFGEAVNAWVARTAAPEGEAVLALALRHDGALAPGPGR